MANHSQLTLIKQGVKAWNNWREKNHERQEIDLNCAYLHGNDLSKTNLSGANLFGANLNGASLREANLMQVNLTEADLRGANLIQVNLIGANLREAYLSKATNLSEAKLIYADLRQTSLIQVNLTAADLSEAYLSKATFNGADLSRANLSRANLDEAKLLGSQLTHTNFNRANLSKANLTEANLTEANLTGANLTGANLNRSQVLNTSFSNAKFSGACIADWHIGSSTKLDNIACDYIFRTTDLNAKFSGRLPVNEDSFFAPGEFTQRFQILTSALETIDLTFTEGIDWQAFFQSFQEVCHNRPTESLSIQGMERKGQAFVVHIETNANTDKAAIETEVKQLYSLRLSTLEAQYAERLKLQGIQIEDAQQAIAEEKLEKAELRSIMKTMAENQGSKYEFNGPVGNVVDTAASGSQVQSVLHNYAPEQRHNLATAANEIKELLDQLSESCPILEIPAQAVNQIHQDPQLKERVIGALKSGGKTALEKLVDHPAVSIVLAAIEGASHPGEKK